MAMKVEEFNPYRTLPDKEIKKDIKVFIREYVPDLDQVNKNLVEDILFYKAKGPSHSAQYKDAVNRLMNRLNYFHIQVCQAKTVDIKIHIETQIIQLDMVRRLLNVPLSNVLQKALPCGKETCFGIQENMFNEHMSVLPKDIPMDIVKYLSIDGGKYLSLVNANANRVMIFDFDDVHMLSKYGVAGMSEPISSTILVNNKTYRSYNELPVDAMYWAIAASIVHEAAHIKFERMTADELPSKEKDLRSERYAYIVKYNFIQAIIDNADSLVTEDHESFKKMLLANLDRHYYAIVEINRELGLPDSALELN